MSELKFENKDFSRVGRKTEGEDVAKYSARQIVSFPNDTPQAVWEAILEVTDSDHAKAAEYFVSGANHHMRLEAGGYTPEEKAAKALLKAMPTQFAGKSLEDIVALLKTL